MADQTEDSDERAPLLDANGDQDQRKRRNCRTKTFNIALVVAVVLIVCALVGGIVWYELVSRNLTRNQPDSKATAALGRSQHSSSSNHGYDASDRWT